MFALSTASTTNKTHPSNLHDIHSDMKPISSLNRAAKSTSHRIAKVSLLIAAAAVLAPALVTDAHASYGTNGYVLTEVFGMPTSLGLPTAKYNLHIYSLIVQEDAGTAATRTSLLNLTSWVINAWDGFLWDGNGITSSDAKPINDPNTLHGLGIMDNNDFGFTDFGGTPANAVHADATIISYAYYGDANMDGLVNSDDFDQFVYGIGHPLEAKWFNGDWNYDGLVNSDDFDLFTASYNGGAPHLTDGGGKLGAGVVPEPTSACLLLTGLLGIVSRRHRRN